MSVVYLIHEPRDQDFVTRELLPPLPALGFDRLLSTSVLAPGPDAADAMERCAVILAVVSASAATSERFRAEVLTALRRATAVVPVFREPPATGSLPADLADLRKVVGIDASGDAADTLWHRMAELLPDGDEDGDVGIPTLPIGWHEEAFTALFDRALDRQDHHRCAALITHFSRHADGPPAPDGARAALKKLRRKRQFLLMRRYAGAAIAKGTRDFEIRRQYSQALIELKELDRAIEELTPLSREATEAGHQEQFEARGLLGRAHKQRYVDAGGGRAAAGSLRTAIATYRSAFGDSNDGWHGINAASCILRAHRDDLRDVPPADVAHGIARRILATLDGQPELPVWDCATRVEANVDLGDFEQAEDCLGDYLAHPDMDAFEVASTYRQFDEVLQLSDSVQGSSLLRRLGDAAARLRTMTGPVGAGAVYLVIGVADPDWEPIGVPGIRIRARLGTTLSVSGTDETLKALLKDPGVIAVEESRPAGRIECERSVPFVKVEETYTGADRVTFSEDGSAALVAVVDDGIDVLHEAFLDAERRSRIIGIWDQRDPTGPIPPVPECDFGTYHSGADIARYVEERAVPEALRRQNDGHGTHVASIAAGRRCDPFAGGVAPGARVLVVISASDQPTGYSDALLAAFSFIDRIATDEGMPVVVNISQGMNAGGHSGLSRVEAMVDEFTRDGLREGRIVVKSAGNEQDKRHHAKLTVPAGGADDLVWSCQPGGSRTVKVQLWWDAANEYRFQLRAPSGAVSDWVDATRKEATDRFPKRGRYALTFVKYTREAGSMLQVELESGVSPVKATEWALTVEAVRVVRDDGVIHAWLEREGPGPATQFCNRISEEMTLSVPGTAKSVITVGAIDAAHPLKVGGFSSFGPTMDDRKKPDISAPGVQVRAAQRDSASGTGVVACSGTSMAAPHVAGALALMMSRAVHMGRDVPGANIARQMLTDKATAVGPWDRGRGYGVLNVTGLLEAL
jgi:subtilisin family serine protease